MMLVRLLYFVARFVLHRWTRYLAAWVAVLGLAAYVQHKAIHAFDSRDLDPQKRRRDGNDGHTAIDFGGQWMMGRMVALGMGPHVYDLTRLYPVAQQAFPWEDEAPGATSHDSDALIQAMMDTEPKREPRHRQTRATFAIPMMGADALQTAVLTATAAEHWPSERIAELTQKHVGGALYPPTQAVILAPLARSGDPRSAYFMAQWIMLVSGFIAGLGISSLTQGRIWSPVATAMILLYPGFSGGHELGQNAPLSLAILVWGWVLMTRGYHLGGGVVWGLFAFKPVWAAAFLLVAVLTRRWRTCLGMCLVGVAFIITTLPFVGLGAWLDWLQVGSLANRVYNVDGNWIPLSRDLLGIPRRLLIDTDSAEYYERDRWYAHVVGWVLWLIVVETTVRLSQLLPDRARAATGPAAAFLLLAGWLSCFHFMYYDTLLSALGFLVLFDPPRQIVQPKLVILSPPTDEPDVDLPPREYFLPRLATMHPGTVANRTWVANSVLIYLGIILLVIQHSLPWLGLGATFTAGHLRPIASVSAGEPVVKDGKTVLRTPKVEVGTATHGPAWDTLLLLGVWLWCGFRFVAESPAPPGTLSPGRSAEERSLVRR